MGGGSSKSKVSDGIQKTATDGRAVVGSHSAPPATQLHRRGSMMPLDPVVGSKNPGGNVITTTTQRRGQMAPEGSFTRQPTLNNLNATRTAMRRQSSLSRIKLTRDKVGHLGDDEFGDDGDVFGVHANTARRPNASNHDEQPAAALFGRKAGAINAAAIIGNEAGGDLSNAALAGLQPGVVKGSQRGIVSETTVTGRKQRAFFTNDDDLDDQPLRTESALSKIAAKARTATQANELQRRQTARELLGGTLNATKSFAGTTRSREEDVPAVNGTTRVKTLLENMKQFRYSMRAKRDMSDADVQDIHAQQEQYGRVKLHIANEIASIGRRVDIVPPQVKAMCVEFIHSIIVETDQRTGNVEVLSAFLKHLFSVDWVNAIHEQEWIFISAGDGSAKFLDVLLGVPLLNDGPHHVDSVELLRLCITHSSKRLPLTFVFVKHWTLLNVSELREEMQPLWQEIFVAAASYKRAIPNEDRAPRMQLLHKILGLSHIIKIDFQAPSGDDGLSIMQRCVAEADVALLGAIVASATGVEWNHIYADGHTVLSMAVEANHKLMTEVILGCRDVDAFQFLPVCNGHVLDLAKSIKANPAIIAAIEQKMKITSGAADAAAVDKTPMGGKKSFMVKRAAPTAEALAPILPDFLKNPPAPWWADAPDWEISTTDRAVEATQEVLALLVGLHTHMQRLNEAKANLLSSEAAEQEYFELEDAMPALKQSIAASIMQLGRRIVVEGTAAKDMILETVSQLLHQQEAPNNAMLIRVLVYRIITVDFAPYLSDQQWVLHAVQNANLEIAESLLRVSKVWQEEIVVDIVHAAATHHSKRMPLVNLVLRYAEQLRLASHADHLRFIFQEFWEGITNPAKFIGMEDRSVRKEVLYRLAAAPFISLQFEQEFAGSQTVFSRACREGDIELVEVMLRMRMLKDVNRVHSNKSTALMQAVVGNQVEVVRMLVRDPIVDIHVSSPHGTALELAQKMRRDPAIVEELKRATAGS